jgi:hypothetical protein
MTKGEAKPDRSLAADSLRRRQISGLLILVAAIVAASIYHSGPGQVFPPGWWRLW